MSPTSARRFARRQWRRRLRRARQAILLGSGVLVAGVLAWVIWFSPLLDVRSVTVRGLPAGSALTASDIRTAAGVSRGLPLARVDLDTVRTRLLGRIPALRTATVERAWPHEVVVEVTERTPVAVWWDQGTYRLVDAEGVAFRRVGQPPEGLLPIRLEALPAGGRFGADQGTSRGTDQGRDAEWRAETLRAAAEVAQDLPGGLRSRVVAVFAGSPDAVRLRLRAGADVMWGSAEQAGRKAKVLEVLLEERDPATVESYDVSVPAYPSVKT